jgi:prepilin-type processing-associated H-X9-DG protein
VSIELGVDEESANRIEFANGTQSYEELSEVFADGDTEPSPAPSEAHYVINERISPFRSLITPTNFTAKAFNSGVPAEPMRIASIRSSSEVGLVWDGPQFFEDTFTFGNGSAWPRSDFVDGYRLGFFDWWGMSTDNTGGWSTDNYSLPLAIGVDGSPSARSKAGQERYNVDRFTYSSFDTAFRFRHRDNEVLNMLFVDGHVEPRALGQLTPRDVAVPASR